MIESFQGGEKGALLLGESDPGKSGIEELVQGLAAGLGVDPVKLVFKWGREPPALDEQFLTLKVYLGKKSETLSFSAELVQSSVENAFGFISAYTDYVIAALRRLITEQPNS